eukprot:gene27141-35865_t
MGFQEEASGIQSRWTRKRGYSLCLNSGTVLWFKSALATEILDYWWASAADPMHSTIEYNAEISISSQKPTECTVKFTDKWPESLNWRLRWPWEQAKQYKVQSCYAANIMILSFPDLPNLPWTSKKDPKSQYPTDSVEPWCFSHWPGAECFITHSAASRNQKRKIVELYSKESTNTSLASCLRNSESLPPLMAVSSELDLICSLSPLEQQQCGRDGAILVAISNGQKLLRGDCYCIVRNHKEILSATTGEEVAVEVICGVVLYYRGYFGYDFGGLLPHHVETRFSGG